MKKIITLLFSLAVLVSFTACGQSADEACAPYGGVAEQVDDENAYCAERDEDGDRIEVEDDGSGFEVDD